MKQIQTQVNPQVSPKLGNYFFFFLLINEGRFHPEISVQKEVMKFKNISKYPQPLTSISLHLLQATVSKMTKVCDPDFG